jgi:hypothetical protein
LSALIALSCRDCSHHILLNDGSYSSAANTNVVTRASGGVERLNSIQQVLTSDHRADREFLDAAVARAVDSQWLSDEPSWRVFATFLYCGKIYAFELRQVQQDCLLRANARGQQDDAAQYIQCGRHLEQRHGTQCVAQQTGDGQAD